jgi:hypothetical protein
VSRAENDHYPTPGWAVNAVVPVVDRYIAESGDEFEVFDPAAGGGALLLPFVGKTRVSGMEIGDFGADEKLNVVRGDFLAAKAPNDGTSRIIVMNPPYGGSANLAQRFVEHAFEWCGPDGVVVALLRMNWIADGGRRHGRHALMRRIGTPDVYVLTKRPSFTGNGKTDASTYAWFVWDACERNEVGKFTLLDVSP